MSRPAVSPLHLGFAGKNVPCSFGTLVPFPLVLLIPVMSQVLPRAGEWILLHLLSGVIL